MKPLASLSPGWCSNVAGLGLLSNERSFLCHFFITYAYVISTFSFSTVFFPSVSIFLDIFFPGGTAASAFEPFLPFVPGWGVGLPLRLRRDNPGPFFPPCKEIRVFPRSMKLIWAEGASNDSNDESSNL